MPKPPLLAAPKGPARQEDATDGPAAAVAKAFEEVTKAVLKYADFGGDASSFATGTPDERPAWPSSPSARWGDLVPSVPPGAARGRRSAERPHSEYA